VTSPSAPSRAVASPVPAWRPGVLACVLVAVGVGWAWGWPAVALAVVASAGALLHRHRAISVASVLLLIAFAASVASVIVVLDARATFLPFGLEDLAPVGTTAFLVARIAPLAGAMSVLALSVRISGLPVGASLLVAYGAALATAVTAFIAGLLVAIAGGVIAGGEFGAILSHLTTILPAGGAPVLYAAPLLPLLIWTGVRLRGSWPVLCAIAATLVAMRL
jgi:hypothetical protein